MLWSEFSFFLPASQVPYFLTSDLFGMVTEHKLTIRAKINPILKILHQYRYEVALKYIKISEQAAGRKSEIVAFDHISCNDH